MLFSKLKSKSCPDYEDACLYGRNAVLLRRLTATTCVSARDNAAAQRGTWGLACCRALLGSHVHLRSSSLLALTKLMAIDPDFCDANLALIFTLLEKRQVRHLRHCGTALHAACACNKLAWPAEAVGRVACMGTHCCIALVLLVLELFLHCYG